MEIQGEFVVLDAIQVVGKVYETTHQNWAFSVGLTGGKPVEFEYASATEAELDRNRLVSILNDRERRPA
jgi:hypothetical protein